MKTTVDLPTELIERAKIVAAKRKSTLKKRVIEGLELTLGSAEATRSPTDAIARLQKGYKLGGKPMTRDETHAG